MVHQIETGLDKRETITESDVVVKTIRESFSTNQPWVKHEGLQQLEQIAKENGSWINDVSKLTDGAGDINNGTENTVYLSKTGKSVIKVNNLSFLNEDDTQYNNTRDLDYFFNRILAHNQLFPEDAYKIIGFSNDTEGRVSVILEQPYISSIIHPTKKEIDFNLADREFVKTILGKGINEGLTGYSDVRYELTDAKPLNVLKDEKGNLHFIDLDISPVIISATENISEFDPDNNDREKDQKPDWVTTEQWEIKPNIYHWEQSGLAMQWLKELQNQLPLTHEQVIQEQRQRLIQLGLSTDDYNKRHK